MTEHAGDQPGDHAGDRARERGGEHPPADLVVTARPIRTARVANISGLVVVVAFVVIAFVEPHASAGAHFGVTDQVFTGLLGVILAAGLHLPARPRLRADATSVRFRGYAGNWREVPWTAVGGVEFPKSVRFARLVFLGDESFALYAVQRADRAESVQVMRGLRALLAASREQH